MKKLVRQQNYLKELIDTQANRQLSTFALDCLFRSNLQPLLDAPESGVVLYRLKNKNKYSGLLKRLEFSTIDSHDYSDESGNLVELVWADTEFLCVLSHRYVSILIWMPSSTENYVKYYSLYNSKFQNEPLDIINRNSVIDIAPYQAKYTPDRRDNSLLNATIRKLLENLEDAADDAVLEYAEKSAETLIDSDFISQKTRVISHEIRNQLSICDLYTEIIRKNLEKGDFDKDSIIKSLNMITSSIALSNNNLLSLKNDNKIVLDRVNLNEILQKAYELSKVYCENKNISFDYAADESCFILADEDKITEIIINIVKNAVEAFEDENVQENGKYIKISFDNDEEYAYISISNNAGEIKTPAKIFDSGYSTKKSGNGFGLWICKKYAKEMNGDLYLQRNSEDYTEFVIKLKISHKEV